jgi:hypothetical protein
VKNVSKIKLEDEKLLIVKMKLNNKIIKILVDTGATTEMVEEGMPYLEEVRVNEVVQYADGMKERIEKKRKIQLETIEGEKIIIWALVVRSLPERVILGNTFMKKRAIINYKENELIIENDEERKQVNGMSVAIVNEEQVLLRMKDDYKCLKGILKNEKWYKMVLGWILKFENAKDENGWMWAKVEPYKPEMIDEREVNMKEYKYVGERKKIVDEDIISKVKKGILVPSNSKYGVPVIVVDEENIYTGEMNYRMCPNMIMINRKIRAIQYPGVSPREIADRVNGRYKTKIDIKTCYPHIRVAEGYSKYLAINVQHIEGYGNKFEYRGMPWGATDAGRVLQREMDNMGRANYEIDGMKFERLMKGE